MLLYNIFRQLVMPIHASTFHIIRNHTQMCADRYSQASSVPPAQLVQLACDMRFKNSLLDVFGRRPPSCTPVHVGEMRR